jgi:acetoin utilization deacetylase AcuC-like enzyme
MEAFARTPQFVRRLARNWMLSFPIIYDDGYDLNLGDHVFQTAKYRLIRELLLRRRVASPKDFLAPIAATREQLHTAHASHWINRLENGRLNYHEILRLEIPYSRSMVEASFLAAGGSIEAAHIALDCGASFNLGGGFHHAFHSHGEGFCAVNDIAVAIRVLQREGRIRKAMVIDCDVHQGNGTAAIFALDASVFTLSIHQANNYPQEKPPSNLDVNLDDGTGDREYLDKLRPACEESIAAFEPELVIYVAGADPFFDDQLGGLALSKEGLLIRDRVVFNACLRHGIPVAVVLAGGYARYIEDTVEIHANTVVALRESLRDAGNGR